MRKSRLSSLEFKNNLIKLLPFVFTFHNLEEIIFIENQPSNNFLKSSTFNTTQVEFVFAAIVFSIIGFILVFGLKRSKHYPLIINAFSGALFLNSFFPHILSSIIFRAYTPGVVTAIILIIPTTGFILKNNYQDTNITKKQFFVSIAYGVVVGILLIWGLQFLGKVIL